MSLAWGGLVLLLLLLPGVLFFSGLYIPESFTRETAERSVLGQLAGVLFISLVVHGALLTVSSVACPRLYPCVSFQALAQAVTLDGREQATVALVAANLQRFWPRSLAWVSVAAVIGLVGGYAAGRNAAAGGILRFLAQHRWVHRLSAGDNLTVAYVLTHVRQDERVLMYRGFVQAFGLQKNGCFSYITLSDAQRLYMKLERDAPSVAPERNWRRIGSSRDGAADKLQIASGSESYFVIEGEDIANVVFEKYPFAAIPSIAGLAELIQRMQKEFLDAQASPVAVVSHSTKRGADENF